MHGQSREKCARKDKFRYIKIQPKNIDLSTRLWVITKRLWGLLAPEFRAELCCFMMKLVYIHEGTHMKGAVQRASKPIEESAGIHSPLKKRGEIGPAVSSYNGLQDCIVL